MHHQTVIFRMHFWTFGNRQNAPQAQDEYLRNLESELSFRVDY